MTDGILNIMKKVNDKKKLIISGLISVILIFSFGMFFFSSDCSVCNDNGTVTCAHLKNGKHAENCIFCEGIGKVSCTSCKIKLNKNN